MHHCRSFAAESDVDDFPILFLGARILVTGYLTDELRSVLRDARFSVEEESSISYAPASTEAGPEIQVFVNCRRLASMIQGAGGAGY
jgi:hypothetical protein